MTTRTVTALFDDYEAAARAVDKLEAEGIPHGDISIVASDPDSRLAARAPADRPAAAEESDAADGAGTGATLGTVLGGGAGLLAGLGLLAIPGVGPVVAAGWLVATVTGAGVGAAAGGLIGGLTGAGLSQHEAETYAEGVRRGGTLVTARVDGGQADRALAILDKHGSIDLDERAQGWRAEGWTGGGATDGDVASSASGLGTASAAGAASGGLGDPSAPATAGLPKTTDVAGEEPGRRTGTAPAPGPPQGATTR
jgi:hypothetical protein